MLVIEWCSGSGSVCLCHCMEGLWGPMKNLIIKDREANISSLLHHYLDVLILWQQVVGGGVLWTCLGALGSVL